MVNNRPGVKQTIAPSSLLAFGRVTTQLDLTPSVDIGILVLFLWPGQAGAERTGPTSLDKDPGNVLVPIQLLKCLSMILDYSRLQSGYRLN